MGGGGERGIFKMENFEADWCSDGYPVAVDQVGTLRTFVFLEIDPTCSVQSGVGGSALD